MFPPSFLIIILPFCAAVNGQEIFAADGQKPNLLFF